MSPALTGRFFTTSTIWKAQLIDYSLPNNDEISLFEAQVILFQNKYLFLIKENKGIHVIKQIFKKMHCLPLQVVTWSDHLE